MTRPRHQIVVGVDGTSASSAAVSWATAEARRSGADLHLMIAGDPARADYAADTVCDVAARCRRESPDLEVVEEVVVDHPVHALLHRSAQAQLVVVGSRGRSRFVNALLGSVSAPVVAASACPVIVVRPKRFRQAEAESSPAHGEEIA